MIRRSPPSWRQATRRGASGRGAGVAAVQLELVGPRLERGDDERDVRVEVGAELLGAATKRPRG